MSRLRVDLEISTFHIDFSDHVSNVVYIQWLEVARCRLFEAVGLPVHEIVRTHGIVPVLLETNIAYKKQLVLGQRPYLEVGIAELGRAGALMTMVIFHEDGQVAAEATQRGMFCTYPELRPYRIPPEIRQRFEQFVAVAPR